MMGDIIWEEISDKSRATLRRKTAILAGKVAVLKPRRRMSLKVSLYFEMSKMMHRSVLKTEQQPSLDNQFYIDRGWIKPKKD